MVHSCTRLGSSYLEIVFYIVGRTPLNHTMGEMAVKKGLRSSELINLDSACMQQSAVCNLMKPYSFNKRTGFKKNIL
jgi:hypothetical protein